MARGFNLNTLLRPEYLIGGVVILGVVGWFAINQRGKEEDEDDELLKEIEDITKPKPKPASGPGSLEPGEPPGTGQGAVTPPPQIPPYSASPNPYQYNFPYVPPGFNPNPYPSQRPIVTQPPPVGGDIPPSDCTCPDGKFYDHCGCKCVPEGSIVTMCYRNCGCPGDAGQQQASYARSFYAADRGLNRFSLS